MDSIEDVVVAVHENIARIKEFVAEQEATINIDATTDPDAVAMSSVQSVFDAFMNYTRCTVAAAANGSLGSIALNEYDHGKPTKNNNDELSHLRQLVATLASDLQHTRQEKAELMDDVQTFNETLRGFRDEHNVLHVYKERIIELQAVLNGTKRPDDITAEIGPPPQQQVPVDALPNEEQRRREVANQLAKLTTMMKDKMDRQRAEKLKISAEKTALLGENRLLLDRVKVLEAQLSSLSSASSVTLRELEKQRVQNAMLANGSKDRVSNPKLKPGECVVAGVVMEKDVALWLRDMYKSLLNDPDASTTLANLRPETPQSQGRGSQRSSQPPRPYSQMEGRGGKSFGEHVASVRRASKSPSH